VTTRVALLGLVLLTGLLVDTVVLSGIAIGGVSPSVVILAVTAVALTDGGEAGARFGFAAGIAVDLLAGGLMGLSALVYLLVGFAIGLLRPYLDPTALTTQVLAGAAATAAAVLTYGGLSLLLDPQGLTGTSVIAAAVGVGLLTGLLAPLVVRPVGSLLRRIEVTLPT
jgi:rod shape-determining protein MreD